jgi:3-demethoxyubiquinol 3-hydroxylase
MKPQESCDQITVLYDGSCPLCRREIAHLQGLAERQEQSSLCFVDISKPGRFASEYAVDRAALLARFHVQCADGSLLHGAAAFVEMWRHLPGWRWLARLAQLPGMLTVMAWAYRGFLRVRPRLQAIARFFETRA